MPAIIDRAKAGIATARARQPWLDRVLRMNEHYGAVKGSQQAGAVTYFGFLSVFPVLALAFFVVGYVAKVFSGANHTLVKAITQVLPGVIGEGQNELSLSQVQDAASAAGLIGLVGVAYAGLGWLSSVRSALVIVFEMPKKEEPNFIIGKLRDLLVLAVLGVVLLLAVAVTGFVSGFSKDVLGWVGLSDELSWAVALLGLVIGLAANAVLFFAMFTLLAGPTTPRTSLWSGAFLGAVGFEILKNLSSYLLQSTKGQPAFQAFGIALILLVWINYFSRVVLYAAAFAHVSRKARAQRVEEYEAAPVQGPPLPGLDALASRTEGGTPGVHRAARPGVAVIAAGLAGTAVGAVAGQIFRKNK